MAVVELNHIRTHIIRMICNENNEQILNEIGRLLMMNSVSFEDAPCRYSSEKLRQRVCQATTSIREGKGLTIEEVKSLHPCLV